MFACGREALPDLREWSGDKLGCLKVFRMPFRMSGSGRKGLLDVWEYSESPPECPGHPLGCPGVVRRPSRMSRSGRKSLPEGRECPLICPGVFGRPSQMTGSAWEALSDVG